MLSRGYHVDDAREQTVQMRRAPRQARGQQRVSAILDAAERLFDETGYDAATTNEIAGRAGVPIGSVYQFFPNKDAIRHAVAQRYRDGFAALYDALLAEGIATLPLPVLVNQLIDAMIAYGSEHIGVTRIVLQGKSNPHVAAAADMVQRDMIGRFETLIAARAPHLAPERRTLVATVGLTAVFALLSLAITAKYTSGHDHMFSIFEQTKLMTIAYLEAATR